MVELALLCSLVIVTTWTCWLAARVRRLSNLVSRSLKRVPDPPKWESRLAELAGEVVSLSSSFEKVATGVTRLNSRNVMRDRRSAPDVSEAPPPGASKAELRRYYNLQSSGPEFARRQLTLVPKE